MQSSKDKEKVIKKKKKKTAPFDLFLGNLLKDMLQQNAYVNKKGDVGSYKCRW